MGMAPTHAASEPDASGVPDPIGPPDLAPAQEGREQHDVVRRFAERGEEALHRLADLPGGSRALKAVSELGRRVDELGRKVRGVDELERRLEQLEREVAELRAARPS